MFVYENIISHVLNKYSNIKMNCQTDSILYIFTNHILSHTNIFVSNNNIMEYIRFKYYILKNFIFNSSTSPECKDVLLKFFCEIQHKYNTLIRFKNISRIKTKKYLDYPIDLQFNELTETKESLKIDIIQNNIKYCFCISDLIKIINTCLSYEDEFFPEPTVIKNPWNNDPFDKSHLYSIYFHILHSNIKMPILFSRFFYSNFNLKKFVINNQYIINKYIIENSNNMTNTLKYRYIDEMITEYNIRYKTCKINISKTFPNSLLHNEFNSYLKLYLYAYYSYEDDIRILYRKILFKKLKHFKSLNPYFGNMVKFNDIYKMYYLSLMIEDPIRQGYIFGVPKYFPKSSVICLKEKGFYIDSITSYAKINEFSYFPVFKNDNEEDKHTNYILKCNDILDLFKFVRNYNFSQIQYDYIKQKHNKDICDKINEKVLDVTDMNEQLRELLCNLHHLQDDIDEFNNTISDDEDDEDDEHHDSIQNIQQSTQQGLSLSITSAHDPPFIINTTEIERTEYEDMYRFNTLVEASNTLSGFVDNDDTLSGFVDNDDTLSGFVDNDDTLSDGSAL